MMKKIACMIAILLLLICLIGNARAADLSEQFKYRSIAIQGHMGKEALEKSPFFGEAMLREVARLGYNDICFHVEWGEQTEKITEIHAFLEENGYIELMDELGLTASVWVREFVDWDPEEWGEPSADNEKLFKALEERYEAYFQIWPELDYFVITNTETQMSPKGQAAFKRIFDVIGSVARKHGANIIVRSFFHGPRSVWLEDMSPVIPDYALIQHKYVEGDWSLTKPNNILIGMDNQHPVIVEFDIGGEYYETDHILNCFADELAERMQYIIDSGAQGISVRINRFGGNAFDHPNAINYWYLGLLTSGQVENVEEAWQKYANEMFPEDVADEMIAILQPTGPATAEAMSIGRNAYGNARNTEIAATRYDRQSKRFEHPLFLEAHKSFMDDSKEAEAAEKQMQKILHGDPEIIDRETQDYKKHLQELEQSLKRLESIQEKLPEETYKYIHWLLEETIWNLKTMEEAQLANLKVFRIRYGGEGVDKEELKAEIEDHLKTIEKLHLIDKSISGEFRSRSYSERRGSYAEAGKFATEFRIWMHHLGLGDPLMFDKNGDGKKEEVTNLDEFIGYHVSRGWSEREASRWVYFIKKKSDSYEDWKEKRFGGIEVQN
ncbi:MAG: hypothetical protein ACLFUS_10185 [Candidatus Sumerlaeia bacterium]